MKSTENSSRINIVLRLLSGVIDNVAFCRWI